MKFFEFSDASDGEELGSAGCISGYLRFFTFVQKERVIHSLQFFYEYDPYPWGNPLFGAGFSILDGSAFGIYFRIKKTLVRFDLFYENYS